MNVNFDLILIPGYDFYLAKLVVNIQCVAGSRIGF